MGGFKDRNRLNKEILGLGRKQKNKVLNKDVSTHRHDYLDKRFEIPPCPHLGGNGRVVPDGTGVWLLPHGDQPENVRCNPAPAGAR